MKKILLFSLVLSTVLANGQAVLTKKNAPVAGSINYISTDTLPMISLDSAGANRQWDFSSLKAATHRTQKYVLPSQTPYSAKFPGANLAISDTNQNIYLKVDSSAFVAIGTTGKFMNKDVFMTFKPKNTIMKFPSTYKTTYGDTYTSVSQFAYKDSLGGFYIDSIRIRNKTISIIDFDAYGDLKMPNVTYKNVLRQAKVTDSFDSIDIKIKLNPFISVWQKDVLDNHTFTPEFTYFSDLLSFPVATVRMDSLMLSPVAVDFYNDTLSRPIANNDYVTVYKNQDNSIKIKKNDLLFSSVTLSITVNPAHGVAVITNDSIKYTPATGFEGKDSLQYALCNGSICDSAWVLMDVVHTSSVKTEKGTGFVLYPNPVRSEINISIQQEAIFHIFGLDGRELDQHQLKAGKNILDLPLQNGMYIYQIISLSGSQLGNGKVSIQK